MSMKKVLRHLHWNTAGDVAPARYPWHEGVSPASEHVAALDSAGTKPTNGLPAPDPPNSDGGQASHLKAVGSGRARFHCQGVTNDGGLLLDFRFETSEDDASAPRGGHMTAAPQVHGIEAPGRLLFEGQLPPIVGHTNSEQGEPAATARQSQAQLLSTVAHTSRKEEQPPAVARQRPAQLSPVVGDSTREQGQVTAMAVQSPAQSSPVAGHTTREQGQVTAMPVQSPGAAAVGVPSIASLPARSSTPADNDSQESVPRVSATFRETAAAVTPPVTDSVSATADVEAARTRAPQGNPPHVIIRAGTPMRGVAPGGGGAEAGLSGVSGEVGREPGTLLERKEETQAGEESRDGEGSGDSDAAEGSRAVAGEEGGAGREKFAEAAHETAHAAAARAIDLQLEEAAEQGEEAVPVPPLKIAILVAGTRGDVQPFVALALALQAYGHTVRLATHAPYKEAIELFGLHFFPLGGDPEVLSDFIVRNRGVWPTSAKDAFTSIKQVEEIVRSTYPACTEPDPQDGTPFTAQAIIANPPVYGHIHCAEKLGVPLHMVFTMPWSPTKAFPHPLARLANKEVQGRVMGIRNQLSYAVVGELIWRGLEPAMNRFRTEVLDLEPLRLGNRRPHLLSAYRVPFSYCWSEALVPKPEDWGPHLDVIGYLFLNESSRLGYEPPPELAAFLEAGPPPVYVGFGSLVVDDPHHLTAIILEAAERIGQRILLSRGWGKLGDGFELPPSVLALDNSPHDWLLPRCSAVVHHGGAGTTAAGLLAGCPTTVVYFFGDQPFWGGACARAGVGPPPIPVDTLTADSLAAALTFMQQADVVAAAKAISGQIRAEDGLAEALASFHRHLPLDKSSGSLRHVDWDLAEPSYGAAVSGLAAGVAGLFTQPVNGVHEDGLKGGLKGAAKGVWGLGAQPVKGLRLAARKARTKAKRHCAADSDEVIIVAEDEVFFKASPDLAEDELTADSQPPSPLPQNVQLIKANQG